MYILKLNPVFKDYIWGGTKLRDEYGFESDFEKLAEGWMLSCHKDGENTIANGEFAGKSLTEIIKANPDFLGENGKKFADYLFIDRSCDCALACCRYDSGDHLLRSEIDSSVCLHCYRLSSECADFVPYRNGVWHSSDDGRDLHDNGACNGT